MNKSRLNYFFGGPIRTAVPDRFRGRQRHRRGSEGDFTPTSPGVRPGHLSAWTATTSTRKTSPPIRPASRRQAVKITGASAQKRRRPL